MTDTEHDDADTGEFDTKALLARAIESLPKKTDLIYIDRGDELDDKQCALIVGGKSDEVVENFDFMENEDNAIDYYLEQSDLDEDEREALKDSDDFDAFVDECRERDESTPLADLIRNTGRKMVRFYIRKDNGDRNAVPYNYRGFLDDDKAESEAKRLCRLCGLNWQENAKSFRELVDNASSGGVLCIIANVEMRDVNKWVEFCHRNPERGRVRLTFTNPNILLHDPINGSGHDVGVKGKVRVRFGLGGLDDTHGAMSLDARNVGTGYSWQETAATYNPAYNADPEAYYYQKPKGSKPDKPAPEWWPGC